MGRRRILLAGFFVSLLALTTLLAGSPAPTSQISVGDFAVLVASKIDSSDTSKPLTPGVAADILRKHGLKVSSELNSGLTEKDAADLFAQLGISLQTEHPENILNHERATRLIEIFGSNLAAAGEKGTTSFASKTSGATLNAASLDTTPFDCQSLPRPPAPCSGPQSVCNPCMDCCKNQLGLTGKTCGRLCQKKNLVVSPEEPTP
ncbi:MAG TPA: hypothetical protein VGR67_01710 [Candidatus Polarisedimenticolia bacterium]|nr:hypothetical protein [Candidatus Polarisedimenticolia bacterium]